MDVTFRPNMRPAEDLAFLIALVSIGDREGMVRLFDIAYPAVEQWLAAGIADGPRRDRLVLIAFEQMWVRAEEFDGRSVMPWEWIAAVVLDVVRGVILHDPIGAI